MLVRFPRASVFGLCGAIAIAAAQASLYRAHASRGDIMRSIQIPTRQLYAIDSNTYKPLTRQEARGVDASFKGLGAHSMQKGEKTGIGHVSREETVILSILEPYSRPLSVLSQRNCSQIRA